MWVGAWYWASLWSRLSEIIVYLFGTLPPYRRKCHLDRGCFCYRDFWNINPSVEVDSLQRSPVVIRGDAGSVLSHIWRLDFVTEQGNLPQVIVKYLGSLGVTGAANKWLSLRKLKQIITRILKQLMQLTLWNGKMVKLWNPKWVGRHCLEDFLLQILLKFNSESILFSSLFL